MSRFINGFHHATHHPQRWHYLTAILGCGGSTAWVVSKNPETTPRNGFPWQHCGASHDPDTLSLPTEQLGLMAWTYVKNFWNRLAGTQLMIPSQHYDLNQHKLSGNESRSWSFPTVSADNSMNAETQALHEQQAFSSIEGSMQQSLPSSMVLNYENRLRQFSSPEKLFAYFASENINGEMFMTFEDLVLSITPNLTRSSMTMEGAGVSSSSGSTHSSTPASSVAATGASGSLTSANVTQADKSEVARARSERAVKLSKIEEAASRLKKTNIDISGDGLISFSEYLFFRTLLSIKATDFSLVFSMFDADGSGQVDFQEFHAVLSHVRTQSRVATTQRLESFGLDEQSAIFDRFFGKDRKGVLDFETFKDYVNSIQREIWALEFEFAGGGLLDEDKKKMKGKHSEEDMLRLQKIPLNALLAILIKFGSGNITPYLDRLRHMTKEQKWDHYYVTLEEWLTINDFIQEINRAASVIDTFRPGDAVYLSDFVRAFRAITGKPINPMIATSLFAALGGEKVDDANYRIDGTRLWSTLQHRVSRFRNEPMFSSKSFFRHLRDCVMRT